MIIKNPPVIITFIKYLLYCLFMLMIVFVFGGCWKGYVRPESEQGFYYVVQKGDTLYRIARENHVSLSQLAERNGLKNPDMLKEGTVLFIPGTGPTEEVSRRSRSGEMAENIRQNAAGRDAPVGEAAKRPNTTVVENKSDKEDKAEESQARGKAIESARNVEEKQEKTILKQNEEAGKSDLAYMPKSLVDTGNKRKFIWPLKGKVVSKYGKQPNGMFYNGIRIETDKETAVGAACSGHVIFSALLKDYGETIIIKHDNNYATVYTHLSKRLVRVDQRINKGDKIAVIVPGNTGAAYFDFEIRYKNKAKDPLLFL
ncbi:MAG: M23 family metallopeptidase [Syntrophaceae bacterium]|nr:M23 family metallopeptidase [Syntrophaceae bacterium]